MLVLTRNPGESIMVGDIEITIVRVSGKQVRVGIIAPKEVPVHRLEVYKTKKKEGQ